MTKIRYIPEMKRYYILFEDGSKGWASQQGIEGLFPDRAWDIVRKYTNQWFYI